MTSKTKSELVGAIAKVMGEVGKLSKENMNAFDKYKFTSIDDFMAATGKACSANGLAVIQNEVGREVIDKKGKGWLLLEFTFTVMHVSGESLEPLKRSVAVPFNGAQAFGSAQSYSLKQFMRSLFQISTGDADDADYGMTHDAPSLPATKKAEEFVAPMSEDTVKDIYAVIDPLEEFPTQEVFHSWVEELKGKRFADLSQAEGAALLEAVREPSKWNAALRKASVAVLDRYEKSIAGAAY